MSSEIENSVSASGHIGIDHNEVIDLYVGRHPLNSVGSNGEQLDKPEPWGYRRISRHYGCTSQNVRRHIQSEQKKYPGPNGEPLNLRVVFPAGAVEPTVPKVEKVVVKKDPEVVKEEKKEEVIKQVNIDELKAFIVAETGVTQEIVDGFFEKLNGTPVDANFLLRQEFKGSTNKVKGAIKKFMGLRTNMSNDEFAGYLDSLKAAQVTEESEETEATEDVVAGEEPEEESEEEETTEEEE